MTHPDVYFEILLPGEAFIAQWTGVFDAHGLMHLLMTLHVVLGREQPAALGTRVTASLLHAVQPWRGKRVSNLVRKIYSFTIKSCVCPLSICQSVQTIRPNAHTKCWILLVDMLLVVVVVVFFVWKLSARDNEKKGAVVSASLAERQIWHHPEAYPAFWRISDKRHAGQTKQLTNKTLR